MIAGELTLRPRGTTTTGACPPCLNLQWKKRCLHGGSGSAPAPGARRSAKKGRQPGGKGLDDSDEDYVPELRGRKRRVQRRIGRAARHRSSVHRGAMSKRGTKFPFLLHTALLVPTPAAGCTVKTTTATTALISRRRAGRSVHPAGASCRWSSARAVRRPAVAAAAAVRTAAADPLSPRVPTAEHPSWSEQMSLWIAGCSASSAGR